MISYDNLWNVMKEKGISQYALIKKYNISPAQITRLKRNESVSTHTIEMFCRILDCEVGDIMKYIKDDEIQRQGVEIAPCFFLLLVFPSPSVSPVIFQRSGKAPKKATAANYKRSFPKPSPPPRGVPCPAPHKGTPAPAL